MAQIHFIDHNLTANQGTASSSQFHCVFTIEKNSGYNGYHLWLLCPCEMNVDTELKLAKLYKCLWPRPLWKEQCNLPGYKDFL